MLFLATLGAVFGYGIGYILGKSWDLLGHVVWIWVFISVPFLYFLAIAWHELGHALAGLTVGFDLRVYVVGPFYFEKISQKWKFSWNKKTNLSGGMVIAFPTQTHDIADSFQRFVLGGPLSSFLGVLVFGGIATLVQDTLRLMFVLLAFFHLLLFFATAIPFRSGGFFSDGKRFLRLRKNSPVRDLEAQFLSFMTLTQQGILPRNWPKEDLNQMMRLANELHDPYLVYITSYAFQHAMDCNSAEDAYRFLLDYIDLKHELPDSFQTMVWLDSAYFHAFVRKDWEKAEEDLAKFSEIPFIPKSYIDATRAEIAWAKGDFNAFEHWKSQSLQKLPEMLDKSQAAVINERFSLPRN